MLTYFEGPAGAGKTTQLLKSLELHLEDSSVEDGQKILGLTFMHGARRRLNSKLAQSESLNVSYQCSTIDSFASLLASRWRSICRSPDLAPPRTKEERFKQVLEQARRAASFPHVQEWTAWSFPWIIIDEFQDCSAEHLNLLSLLEPSTNVLAAADEFQHLKEEEANCAIRYLEQAGSAISLKGNYRTSVPSLLRAARLARGGEPISDAFEGGPKGLWMQPVRRHYQAAVAAARNICWHGGKHTAILSPSGLSSSAFFKDTVDRLTTEKIAIDKAKNIQVGPFRIRRILSQADRVSSELSKLGLKPDKATLSLRQIQEAPDCLGREVLVDHLERSYRLYGMREVEVVAAIQSLEEKLAHIWAHSESSAFGIEAMTIHQAKNQEFDSVVILWPVEATGSLVYQQRLLYNAITRARRHACILIQDPYGNRLEKPAMKSLFGLDYYQRSSL